MNAPAIYQGAIYATDTLGGVRALKMSTGEKLWHTQMAEPVGEDDLLFWFRLLVSGILESVGMGDWGNLQPWPL